MSKRKYVEISLALGLVFTIIISLLTFNKKCENIRQNVLRLHIVANSDNAFDQKLKLKVRDAVLENLGEALKNSKNIDEAVFKTKENLSVISNTANAVIKENGYNYNAVCTVKKENFGTRVYDDFTLPAGEYNSLKIKIGKASGHNWWCVVFPTVCLPIENEPNFSKTVGKEENEIVMQGGKYVIKFRIIELYEEFKQAIKQKTFK